MTCIVAIAQNGTVYMASDHAASDDKSGVIISRREPKCFKVGQYGIAFTDSFRMGQILQYSWAPPKYTPTKTNSGLDKFMRTKFIDSVKDAFKEMATEAMVHLAKMMEIAEESLWLAYAADFLQLMKTFM